MSEFYIGEIRAFAGDYAPKYWAFCDGQLLPIAQNQALFSILGTFYGGNGTTNFALPNLLGSVPLHMGQGAGLRQRSLGEAGGEAAVTLLTTEMPSHTHVPQAVSDNGTTGSPAGATWSKAVYGRGATNSYSTATPDTTMHPTALGMAGGSQPHNNMPPFTVVNFIIALVGIYPSRS